MRKIHVHRPQIRPQEAEKQLRKVNVMVLVVVVVVCSMHYAAKHQDKSVSCIACASYELINFEGICCEVSLK